MVPLSCLSLLSYQPQGCSLSDGDLTGNRSLRAALYCPGLGESPRAGPPSLCSAHCLPPAHWCHTCGLAACPLCQESYHSGHITQVETATTNQVKAQEQQSGESRKRASTNEGKEREQQLPIMETHKKSNHQSWKSTRKATTNHGKAQEEQQPPIR